MSIIKAYVGTYTGSGSNGIYMFTLDTNSGQFAPNGYYTESHNPSFLVKDVQQQYLYAVNERVDGQVVSFRMDDTSRELTYINAQSSQGQHPCYLTVNRERTFLFAVNYTGGSVCVYPIHEDGSIEAMSHFIQHEGHGPREDRQQSAHPHSIIIDPTNKWIIVADLGIDTLFIYTLDAAARQLVEHQQVKVYSAAGPRHLVFHPQAPYLYVINELDSTRIKIPITSSPSASINNQVDYTI